VCISARFAWLRCVTQCVACVAMQILPGFQCRSLLLRLAHSFALPVVAWLSPCGLPCHCGAPLCCRWICVPVSRTAVQQQPCCCWTALCATQHQQSACCPEAVGQGYEALPYYKSSMHLLPRTPCVVKRAACAFSPRVSAWAAHTVAWAVRSFPPERPRVYLSCVVSRVVCVQKRRAKG
jgi:hypothetical protein